MTTAISLNSRVMVTPDQVSCDLAGEAVILNLANGRYYELNPVGARVWELLQEGRAVVEIRDRLLEEYEVELERCTTDLLDVLADLADVGLVRVAG